MEKEKNKNVIVLRNLPSNIIEEAIVVFKENVKVKKYSSEINKNQKNLKHQKKNINRNQSAVEEAEAVITEYIKGIENQKKNIGYLELKNKYDRLISFTIFSTIFSILCCFSILLRYI